MNIKLLCVRSSQKVDADLLPLSDKHLADVKTFWEPRLSISSEEDRHWDWLKKQAVTNTSPNYESYALECNYITQGLMLLELDLHRSRLEPYKNLIYIDFLATAPWNRLTVQNPPEYKAVGSALFTFAVYRSFELGYKGRVGLHSLPRSEGFYIRQKMVDRGPDPDKQNLRYFELPKQVNYSD